MCSEKEEEESCLLFWITEDIWFWKGKAIKKNNIEKNKICFNLNFILINKPKIIAANKLNQAALVYEKIKAIENNKKQKKEINLNEDLILDDENNKARIGMKKDNIAP